MVDKSNKNDSAALTLGQSINLVRMIAALFVISSIVLQFIYTSHIPDFIDPPEVHWAINIMAGLFFVSTFFIRYKTAKHLDYISITLYAIVQAYTVFLVLINQFNPYAIMLLILVMGGGTVIVTNTLYYLIQSGIILFLMVVKFTSAEFNTVSVLGLFNVLVSIGLFGAVLFIRLRMAKEVKFSNSLLKKIQLFSIIANPAGQIVFVSPSVKAILGYEPKSLLKDGWWENKNLSRSWIEKEHIINYPGVIRPDIKSIESSAISLEGQIIWLSWTTSILPDGNYMGVALDITKYKVH